MVSAHALAASISSAQESETFDLAGQSAGTITSVIESAFKDSFALDDGMIRLTFIIGAGKQARQKYDDGAAKAVTSVLDRYGYEDDRGASCVLESAGCYKMQHDTGKNIKTVVVFPKVVDNENGTANLEAEPIIPEDSAGYKLAVSSMAVFKNMVKAKCPSWSQKKGCLGSIEALKELVQEFDTMLMNGKSLDESEQSFYDACVLLDEKESHVRASLHEMVESGNITKFEQDLLLEHNAEKIASLERENKSTAKLVQRKELLQSIEPRLPHALKYEAEIERLRKELAPLLQMEAAAKGRLLTVKETQILSRKDEIFEEMDYLEESSRGWFEDDDAFESRLASSRQSSAGRRKSKKSSSKTASIDSSTRVRMSVSKWITPGDSKGWSAAGAKKKKKMKAGDVFSAMTMDSDDDDDDQSEEEVETEVTAEDNPSDSASNKKKKKKKKKKKSKAKASQEDAQGAEETASSQDETKEEEETALAQASVFLQTYIIPLLVGIISWFVTLVFGKQKKKKRG